MEIAHQIINWIKNFNKTAIGYNASYHVNPIEIKSDYVFPSYSLQKLVDVYISYILDDFKNGLKDSYSMMNRLQLPNIPTLLSDIASIEVESGSHIRLNQFNDKSVLKDVVINKVSRDAL